MRVWLGPVLLALFWVQPVGGQTPAAGAGPRIRADWIQTWEPPAFPESAYLDGKRAQAMGRSAQGAVAGALLLGTAAAVVRAAMCDRGESCTGPTILWGLMGATVGAVAGGLIAGATD